MRQLKLPERQPKKISRSHDVPIAGSDCTTFEAHADGLGDCSFSPKSRIPEASSTVTERRRPTEVTDGGLLVRCLRGGDGRSAHIARQVARLGNADLSKIRQPFV